MKYFYLLGLIAVLSFAACSDNNEELNEIVLGHQSAVFVGESVDVPSTGGSVNVTIDWNNTEWEIEYESNDNSFISSLSANVGGKAIGEGQTIVTIQCAANTTGEKRSQSINLISKATGNQVSLTLNQLADGIDVKLYRRLYVSPSDSQEKPDGSLEKPFKKISDAALKVEAGDTVLIAGGTYFEENITPITSGTAEAMIVFKPLSDNDKVTIKHPGKQFTTDGTPVFNLYQRSYIWVEGFTFKSYYYSGWTFEMKEANHCVVINNHFEDIGNDKIVNTGISLIRLYNSSDNVICNNYFKATYGDGVGMGRESNNNLLANNTFIEFKGKARGWAGEGSSFTTNITLGDEMEFDSNNLIAFNYSTKGRSLFWADRNGSDNIILRNLGYDAGTFIFDESRCKRNIIQENIGYKINGPAFETARYETGYNEDERLINNIAYKASIGFFMSKSWRAVVRNNIAYLCKDYSFSFDETAAACGPHIFEYNLWGTTQNNGNNCLNYLNQKKPASYLVEQQGGINGPTGDPMFANPDNGDFTLKSGSPAIGAGKLGQDLGAFAVYPPTSYGWNEEWKLSKGVCVSFSKPVTDCVALGQHIVFVKLSSPSSKAISVKVKAVAGDARPCIDYTMVDEISFAPGEVSKAILVNVVDNGFDDNQLLCLQITQVNGAQIGPRNIHAIRIER